MSDRMRMLVTFIDHHKLHAAMAKELRDDPGDGACIESEWSATREEAVANLRSLLHDRVELIVPEEGP